MTKVDLKSTFDAELMVLLLEVYRLKDLINRLGSSMFEARKTVFDQVSLSLPKFTPAELGFIRTVSWLYVLYNEAGKVTIEFLSNKFGVYNLDSSGHLADHMVVVHHLRTYLQHNLDPGKKQNVDIAVKSEEWLRRQCGTSLPDVEEQWEHCLLAILNESVLFLGGLYNCLRSIEQDESREQILAELSFRIKRYHAPHEFEELVSEVAADMGRENIDSSKIVKRFYDKWNNEIKNYKGDYNFAFVARRLIEHTLLEDTMNVLPITGDDIKKFFKIEPGPIVGKLLLQAKILYNQEPTSSEVLLQRLSDFVTENKEEIGSN